MGQLFNIEHVLEGEPEGFSRVTFIITRHDGREAENLSLGERDALYQTVLDFIRRGHS